MSQERSTERPKRNITKPTRYQTTSSDEGPPQKKHCAASAPTGSINDDIEDIRRTLQDKNTYNIETHVTPTQHTQSFTNNSTHLHNNQSLPYKYTPYKYTPNIQMHTYTPPIQTHTNTCPTQTHFMLSKEDGQVFYTNNSLSQSQVPQLLLQDRGFQRGLSEGDAVSRPQDIQQDNLEKRRIEEHIIRVEERMNQMEVEMKKMTGIMNKILKCVQYRQSAVKKPDGLPVTSFQQMQEFEGSTEDYYTDAVNYFHDVGGFSLKEATNLCLKEALHDSLAPSYTWFGREEGRQPLYNTRLIKAIYDAVCRNKYFPKPQRSEFQKQMRDSLRVMKERNRMRMRGHQRRNLVRPAAEHLWDDDEEEKDDDAEEEDNVGPINN